MLSGEDDALLVTVTAVLRRWDVSQHSAQLEMSEHTVCVKYKEIFKYNELILCFNLSLMLLNACCHG